MRHGWTRQGLWRSLDGHYLIMEIEQGTSASPFFNIYYRMNFVRQCATLRAAMDVADKGIRPGPIKDQT